MKRVAILLSGGGSNMQALVGAMTHSYPGRPVLVLSNDPAAGGIAKAAGLQIPTAVVDHRLFGRDRAGFEAALARQLDEKMPDFLCLAGFMRILSADFVARYAGRILNIHPSLLPKYPGLNTHQRAIDAGDAEAGCSVHLVTAELDAGPVLGQARVGIVPGETAARLASKVLRLEHQLYPAVLRRVLDGATPA